MTEFSFDSLSHSEWRLLFENSEEGNGVMVAGPERGAVSQVVHARASEVRKR